MTPRPVQGNRRGGWSTLKHTSISFPFPGLAEASVIVLWSKLKIQAQYLGIVSFNGSRIFLWVLNGGSPPRCGSRPLVNLVNTLGFDVGV